MWVGVLLCIYTALASFPGLPANVRVVSLVIVAVKSGEGLVCCTTAGASYPMSVHEKEPLHNNAHARGPHPHPASTLRLPHVTFQTGPSPLLTVLARNDNEAYNAHVSGEAWERG